MSDIDLVEVLDEHFKVSMQDIRTSFPAKIVKVDIQAGKCSVQPIHKLKIIETGEIFKPSLIEDVPIVFPRSAGSIDVLPLAPGDIGQMIVSDRSISEWLNGNGNPVYTENPNIMEGSQASFLPGAYPFGMKFNNSTLPENARSIIVKSGTFQYFGNQDVSLTLNGGTLEIWNVLKALTAIVTQIDGAMIVPGTNLPQLTELTAAFAAIQVDP